MVVVNLFAGCDIGRLSCEKAKVKVDKYYRSEIDKYANIIAEKNYPDSINLGDIRSIINITDKIDLLMGGSPCQSFSIAGKGEGLDGSSKLFYDFVRVLNACKPKYFLLENVKMKKEWENIISEQLGVEPVEINSALVSAQNRKRLYWTNIPNIKQPKNLDIKLESILENTVFEKEPYVENYKSNQAVNYKAIKFNTLRASAGSKTRGIGICNSEGFWRKLTPIECERLQTVPDNFTEGVSITQRYKMLGNGWTADVIAHILKNIPVD